LLLRREEASLALTKMNKQPNPRALEALCWTWLPFRIRGFRRRSSDEEVLA